MLYRTVTTSKYGGCDLTGRRFGRLVILASAQSRSGRPAFLCRCDCGKEKPIRRDHLLRGESTSCGCLTIEKVRRRFTTHGHTTGGKTSTEYRIWSGMIQRCVNPKVRCFYRYGGRGVTVCDRWNPRNGGSFQNFLQDMGLRPKNKTLDRWPDPFGNYEPGNVRWATASEQARNRRPHPVREKAVEIRKLYASGDLKQSELAERFKVSQAFISELINESPRMPPVRVRPDIGSCEAIA